jgi:hypothetical protein
MSNASIGEGLLLAVSALDPPTLSVRLPTDDVGASSAERGLRLLLVDDDEDAVRFCRHI